VAADVLSKLGSRRALVPAGMFVQDLPKASIKLMDLDNPQLPQHDQTSAPPHDVLMSEEKKMLGASPSYTSYSTSSSQTRKQNKSVSHDEVPTTS
jgi:hypothetical protein